MDSDTIRKFILLFLTNRQRFFIYIKENAYNLIIINKYPLLS